MSLIMLHNEIIEKKILNHKKLEWPIFNFDCGLLYKFVLFGHFSVKNKKKLLIA